MKIGQEVICIEDLLGPYCPKVNDIVTIEGFSTRYPGIFLKEYPPVNGLSHSYCASSFRPLDEVISEIGIAELTEALKPELV